MTKIRKPGTFDGASVTLRDHFTEEGCAAIIGMSVSRVRHACDRDRSSYTPFTLSQALDLDCAYFESTGKPGPLGAVYGLLYREHTGQGVAPCDMSAIERVGHISGELNDVVQTITAATSPNSDGGETETPAECLQTVREIDEAVAELLRHRASYARKAGISPDLRRAGVAKMLGAA